MIPRRPPLPSLAVQPGLAISLVAYFCLEGVCTPRSTGAGGGNQQPLVQKAESYEKPPYGATTAVELIGRGMIPTATWVRLRWEGGAPAGCDSARLESSHVCRRTAPCPQDMRVRSFAGVRLAQNQSAGTGCHKKGISPQEECSLTCGQVSDGGVEFCQQQRANGLFLLTTAHA